MLDKNLNPINEDDAVLVPDPNHDDIWEHSFEGRVIKMRKENVLVEDGDGDVWEVEPDRLEVLKVKRNQMWDLAFTVITDKAQPTKDEMLEAMQKRVDYLKENPDDIFEACGLCDEYETE